MKHNAMLSPFKTPGAWIILSPIEQSIKQKIESIGTPLKDWDINIYRGVLTGCNEAFIISTEKRDEILANCKSEDERRRTAELIRPILRGRDIKRYGYEWADLYLIATHNGYGDLPRVDINDYPAVKDWLDHGGIAYNGNMYAGYKQIAKRSDKGATPYNLRNCAYMDDFSKSKIVWAETMRIRKGNTERFPRFSFSDGHILTDKTCFIATGDPTKLLYILALLNSAIGRYQLHNLVSKMDDGGWLMQKIYIEQVLIPNHHDLNAVVCLAKKIISTLQDENSEDQIDNSFAQAVGLTATEVQYMRMRLSKPIQRS